MYFLLNFSHPPRLFHDPSHDPHVYWLCDAPSMPRPIPPKCFLELRELCILVPGTHHPSHSSVWAPLPRAAQHLQPTFLCLKLPVLPSLGDRHPDLEGASPCAPCPHGSPAAPLLGGHIHGALLLLPLVAGRHCYGLLTSDLSACSD